MKTFLLTQTKNLFVVFCCVTFLGPVKSQTFKILPSNTQTMILDCEKQVINETQIVNLTNHAISLSYHPGSGTNMPDASVWDYQFCNWEYCFPYLPNTNVSVSRQIPAYDTVSMTLDITSNNHNVKGTFILNLYETGNANNFQLLTWNVTGCVIGAGISENTNNIGFNVYPNPARDFVNVEITSGYNKSGSIQVYNLVGEKLTELNGIKNSIQRVDLKGLPAGAYFVKYSTGEGASVKKIFKTE
jgi:hypothetical protein